MDSGFKEYRRQKSNAADSGLSTASSKDLENELQKRAATENLFPLDVFHPSLTPLITVLTKDYDLPRSFVGLNLLACYSTAIGSAYAVTSSQGRKIYMPIWGCMLGLSSSGKSLSQSIILEPLKKIQEEYDREWFDITEGITNDKKAYLKPKYVAFRDIHIQTLVRGVLPQNPKGLIKISDELIEWINGLNMGNKGKGIDEQFWLSSFNCENYSGQRSGNDKFVVPRPFVNIIGGLQYGILHRLFANDRDVTGFVYRVLFAIPEVDKIPDIRSDAYVPTEFFDPHDRAVRALHGVEVEDAYDEPRLCVISREAGKIYDEYKNELRSRVNNTKDIEARDAKSGIFGKILEYTYRFAGILTLMDKALSSKTFSNTYIDNHGNVKPYFSLEEPVTSSVMERAIKISEYFYKSAWDAYTRVDSQVTAPPEIIELAGLMRAGRSYQQIAIHLWGDESKAAKQKVYQMVKKALKQYPRVFNAQAK